MSGKRALGFRGFMIAIALGVIAARGSAQGFNYYVLTNGFDAMYLGVGAGGNQLAENGLGTWIAGEDLRGSHLTQTGDFGFRINGYREVVCLTQAPWVVEFRGTVFVELNGLNGNSQQIFTSPACTTPSFPLGNANGIIPYGMVPGSLTSFLMASPPSGTLPPGSTILLPDNGLSLGTGTADIVFSTQDIAIPVPPGPDCYVMQFTVFPSTELLDDIDGLWHYVLNSDNDNQYWALSTNEMNIWQSNTVGTDGPLDQLIVFPPNVDYDLLLATPEPVTVATLAPRGLGGGGAYYAQVENVRNQNGVSLNPNGGFDVGRGSAAISFSGTAGVPNFISGFGNQNQANAPGTVTTVGFATWDNGGDGNGSVRLTWISYDFAGLFHQNPDLDPGKTKLGGAIRLPVVSPGFLQPITQSMFNLFQHVTSVAPSGWPDPQGLPTGAFAVPAVAGASWQIPVGPQPSACIGMAFNFTYGTSGRLGGVGTAGHLTFNPSIADISGSRELFLFN